RRQLTTCYEGRAPALPSTRSLPIITEASHAANVDRGRSTITMWMKRNAGFAVIEALVIATLVALVAGVTIIAMTATTEHTSSAQACRKEAASFQRAVQQFHDQ